MLSGVLVGDALRAPNALEGLRDAVLRDPLLLEELGRRRSAAFLGDRDEQVLGADELVLDAVGLRLRPVGDEREPRRQMRLGSAVGLRHVLEQLARAAARSRDLDVHLSQQFRHDAVGLLDERDEQVLRLDLGVVALLGEIDGLGDGFAGLFGELVDIHGPLLVMNRRIRYATELFLASPSLCNASKCVRSSGVSCRGSCTSAVA